MHRKSISTQAWPNWRAIAVGAAVLLALAAGAMALERKVASNTTEIKNMEVWFERYDKDFREMRHEVKQIWNVLYEEDE